MDIALLRGDGEAMRRLVAAGATQPSVVDAPDVAARVAALARFWINVIALAAVVAAAVWAYRQLARAVHEEERGAERPATQLA